MSVQTSVSNFPGVGVAGQLADSGDFDVISGKAVTGTFRPGHFVVLDETQTSVGDLDYFIRLVAATGDVTSLFLACGFVVQQTFGENAVNYTAPAIVPVMRRGRILVTVEENVAVGDDVFIRFTANGNGQVGSVRSSADTGTAVALPGAVFMTKASAGGLAVVSYRQ